MITQAKPWSRNHKIGNNWPTTVVIPIWGTESFFCKCCSLLWSPDRALSSVGSVCVASLSLDTKTAFVCLVTTTWIYGNVDLTSLLLRSSVRLTVTHCLQTHELCVDFCFIQIGWKLVEISSFWCRNDRAKISIFILVFGSFSSRDRHLKAWFRGFSPVRCS